MSISNSDMDQTENEVFKSRSLKNRPWTWAMAIGLVALAVIAFSVR